MALNDQEDRCPVCGGKLDEEGDCIDYATAEDHAHIGGCTYCYNDSGYMEDGENCPVCNPIEWVRETLGIKEVPNGTQGQQQEEPSQKGHQKAQARQESAEPIQEAQSGQKEVNGIG